MIALCQGQENGTTELTSRYLRLHFERRRMVRRQSAEANRKGIERHHGDR